MTETTQQLTQAPLTRTQLQFFQAFAEQIVHASYEERGAEDLAEAFSSMIDFKDFGKRLGQAMLSRVSYSDVKAVDKFMRSEQFINVMAALDTSLDSVALTLDDAANAAFTTSFILNTMSPVLAPEEYAQALATTDKPLTPWDQLLMQARG